MKYIQALLFLPLALAFKEPQLLQNKCSVWDDFCFTNTMQTLHPYLLRGFPELGVEPLTKLRVPLNRIDFDGLRLYMSDVEIHMEEAPNMIVERAYIDPSLKRMHMVFRFPYVTYVGHYNTSGFLHKMPFEGDGEMEIKSFGVKIDMSIDYEDIKKDGQTYLDLKKYDYWFEKSNAAYSFTNLFGGDKAKSDAVLLFAHKNWRIVSNKFGRVTLNSLVEQIFKVLQTMYYHVPIGKFVRDY